MKLTSSKLLQGAIALAIFSIGACGYAQDFSKIAVVDYDTILKDYYKAKDSQKQLADLAAGYQKERNEREAGLKTLVESINALQKEMGASGITDAKKKELENQLKAKGEEGQVKQREMMAFGQTASKILEDKRQRLTTDLTEDVSKVLSQVTKGKYNMVFVKPQIPSPGALIYSEGIEDVTTQLLAALNKSAPAEKNEQKK